MNDSIRSSITHDGGIISRNNNASFLQLEEDPYVESKPYDSEDDDDENEDQFDSNSIPMPRLSSSTIPIVVEVVAPSHHGGGYYKSEDPLFQGRCLYSTSSSISSSNNGPSSSSATSQKNCEGSTRQSSPNTESSYREQHLTISWFFPPIFKHLLYKQHSRRDIK